MVIVQHPSQPNPNEPKRYSRTVQIGRGRSRCSGYLAYSDRIGPAVLVLHEFFGMTDSFRAYCDALNAEGFTALALDLYDGKVAQNVEEAESLRDSVDVHATMKRLDAAVEHLTANWHPRVGVVGFSLGAAYAAEIALRAPVEASVHYYGGVVVDPATWEGPLLAHFAEHDEWDSLEDCRAMVTVLAEKGIEVDAQVYEGVGHWFANRDVPQAYDEKAASAAFATTVDFLHHHLA